MFFKKEEKEIKYCHNCGMKLNEFGDCDECIEDIDMGILPPKYRNTIINTVLLVIDYLIISSFILYVLLIIGPVILSYFIPL